MSDLIRRQDAIDAIKKCAMYVPEASTELYMAILAIEELPSVASKPLVIHECHRWIPCSERLPRRDEHDDELGVLVTLGNGYDGLEYDRYFEETRYDKAHWYDWDGYVVAWMPLPAPYEEATKCD